MFKKVFGINNSTNVICFFYKIKIILRVAGCINFRGIFVSVSGREYRRCAKALRRSELWSAESWPDRSAVPSLGCILRDQIALPADVTAESIDESLEVNYAKTLWEPGGKA